MKKLIISSMVLALILSGCGSNESKESSPATLKPESTKINGALGSHYEVIDKEYKTDKKGMFNVLSVSIKRISDDLPFDPNKTVPFGTSAAGKNTHIGFGIELLDESGNSIETINATASGLGGVFSSDDIKSIINMQNGENAIVRWSIQDDLIPKAKSFKITTAIETDNNTSISASNDDQKLTTGSSSNKWDKVIDEYEDFIDRYIKMAKKAQKGDMSAMNEYASLLGKAESLSQKLEENEDDLTPAQIKRFMQLQNKISNAAIDMM